MKKRVLQLILASLVISGMANAEELDVHTFFKSVEHQWLGEQAKLFLPGFKEVSASAHFLRLPNDNELNYGEIIALGGDYYGVPEFPISDGATLADRMQRFKDAFATLANEDMPYRCSYDFCANKILDLFEAESESLRKNRDGVEFGKLSFSYAASIQYYTDGLYLSLAIKNWDHFLPTSMLAYEAGHAAAIEQAVRARRLSSVKEQTAALELAYAMNAFADHYMTDMFASGHVRVPRRELFDQSSFASVGGLLARQMHDEDGRIGLNVHNNQGASWKMHGDGRLFITGADDNRKAVSLAIQTSIAEVYAAFAEGKVLNPSAYGVKKMIAQADKKNSSPLYVLVEGVVLARTQNDLCSYEWTPDWTGIAQLLGHASPDSGPCL